MIRGTLIEIIPNDHATVQLTPGRARSSSGIRFITSSAVLRRRPYPAFLQRMRPRPRRRVRPARVHIASEQAVNIDRRGRQDVGARVLRAMRCAAPDRQGVSNLRRRRPRERLVPPRGAGRAVDHDRRIPGIEGRLRGRIVLTSVGGIAIVVGLLLVAAGAAQNTFNTSCYNGSCTSSGGDGESTKTAGWITGAAGVAGLIGGIVMIANSRTTVEQQAGVRPHDAWKRVPTWREAPSAIAAPGAMSTPIFSGTF